MEDKDEEQFVKPEYRRVFPPKSEVEEGLSCMLDRGVGLYFLFTDGLDEYRYPRQHEDAFRSINLAKRAQIRHIAGATHLVTDLDHQEILLRDLEGWVGQFQGASPPAMAAG
jgi:hypothetical protein